MENHIDIKGLRVAVTGGTSGLGLALVQYAHAAEPLALWDVWTCIAASRLVPPAAEYVPVMGLRAGASVAEPRCASSM